MTRFLKFSGNYRQMIDVSGLPTRCYKTTESRKAYDSDISRDEDRTHYVSYEHTVNDIKKNLKNPKADDNKLTYSQGDWCAAVFSQTYLGPKQDQADRSIRADNAGEQKGFYFWLNFAYIDDEGKECGFDITCVRDDPDLENEEPEIALKDRKTLYMVTHIKNTIAPVDEREVTWICPTPLLSAQTVQNGSEISSEISEGDIPETIKKLVKSRKINALLQNLFVNGSLSMTAFNELHARIRTNRNIDNRDLKQRQLQELITIAKESGINTALYTSFTEQARDDLDFFKESNFISQCEHLIERTEKALRENPDKQIILFKMSLTLAAIKLELYPDACGERLTTSEEAVLHQEAQRLRTQRDTAPLTVEPIDFNVLVDNARSVLASQHEYDIMVQALEKKLQELGHSEACSKVQAVLTEIKTQGYQHLEDLKHVVRNCDALIRSIHNKGSTSLNGLSSLKKMQQKIGLSTLEPLTSLAIKIECERKLNKLATQIETLKSNTEDYQSALRFIGIIEGTLSDLRETFHDEVQNPKNLWTINSLLDLFSKAIDGPYSSMNKEREKQEKTVLESLLDPVVTTNFDYERQLIQLISTLKKATLESRFEYQQNLRTKTLAIATEIERIITQNPADKAWAIELLGKCEKSVKETNGSLEDLKKEVPERCDSLITMLNEFATILPKFEYEQKYHNFLTLLENPEYNDPRYQPWLELVNRLSDSPPSDDSLNCINHVLAECLKIIGTQRPGNSELLLKLSNQLESNNLSEWCALNATIMDFAYSEAIVEYQNVYLEVKEQLDDLELHSEKLGSEEAVKQGRALLESISDIAWNPSNGIPDDKEFIHGTEALFVINRILYESKSLITRPNKAENKQRWPALLENMQYYKELKSATAPDSFKAHMKHYKLEKLFVSQLVRLNRESHLYETGCALLEETRAIKRTLLNPTELADLNQLLKYASAALETPTDLTKLRALESMTHVVANKPSAKWQKVAAAALAIVGVALIITGVLGAVPSFGGSLALVVVGAASLAGATRLYSKANTEPENAVSVFKHALEELKELKELKEKTNESDDTVQESVLR